MIDASPPNLGTLALTSYVTIVKATPPLVSKEWTQVATKYLIQLVKERIESYKITIYKQKYWKRIREQVVKDHSSETK